VREKAGQEAFQALWPDPEGRLRLARLSAAFLRRYSFRSPYPPILVWQPKTLRDVRRAWQRLSRAPRSSRGPLGLYVHVPFCPTKCVFCNCMSVTDMRPASHAAYLDALETELRLLRFPRGLAVDTACLGGGTPTALSAGDLRRLFRILDDSLDLSSCRERMAEVSPSSISEEVLRELEAWGVRRATLGVQTVDPRLLARFRRTQDEAMVRRAFTGLRRHGVRHVSVDLLAGLPGQTLVSFRKSLDFALALEPDSVSVYPFACIRTTPYRVEVGEVGGRDVARREEMLALASGVLARRYPRDPSPLERVGDSQQRVDRDYRNGSVLGLGYSSRSYAKGVLSYVKENHYGRYREALAGGEFPPVRGWDMGGGEAARAFVVDRIEMEGRLDVALLRRLFGKGAGAAFAEPIALARRHGLLVGRGDELRVRHDPDNHEKNALICGKLFYSKEVLARVWELVVRGRA